MRRTTCLILFAGLLTACGGTDDTANGAVTPPATSAPAAVSTAPPAPSTPAIAPGASAPSLSPAKQAETLDKIFERLDANSRKQFCAQSDKVGPAALAEQVAQQGGERVDEQVLKDFLIDKCGKK